MEIVITAIFRSSSTYYSTVEPQFMFLDAKFSFITLIFGEEYKLGSLL
jgi:hypothetical protein